MVMGASSVALKIGGRDALGYEDAISQRISPKRETITTVTIVVFGEMSNEL